MNYIDGFIKEVINKGYTVTFRQDVNGLVVHIKHEDKNVIFPYESINKDYEESLRYIEKEMNKLKGTLY